MDYSILNSLAPAVFTYPEFFVTSYDKPDNYAAEQYAKGLEISQEYDEVYISAYGTWGARKGKRQGNRDVVSWNGTLNSYEGIGYHRGTADLLKGFLAGHAPVYVERWTDSGIAATRIK